MDAVSEVLIARADKSDGMNTMLSVSVIVHLALLGVFVFVPASWFGAEEKRPETIMQVSLGGPVGPDAGGLTTLGGRTIQDVAVETKRANTSNMISGTASRCIWCDWRALTGRNPWPPSFPSTRMASTAQKPSFASSRH